MANKIAVIPGDCVGPEIITESKKVLQAVEKVLANGFRTADIYRPGTRKASTDMMGDLIAEEIRRLGG
jgi:isocitrate/isopropylmalate dehydrogenase